jgi:hypothetical protein
MGDGRWEMGDGRSRETERQAVAASAPGEDLF